MGIVSTIKSIFKKRTPVTGVIRNPEATKSSTQSFSSQEIGREGYEILTGGRDVSGTVGKEGADILRGRSPRGKPPTTEISTPSEAPRTEAPKTETEIIQQSKVLPLSERKSFIREQIEKIKKGKVAKSVKEKQAKGIDVKIIGVGEVAIPEQTETFIPSGASIQPGFEPGSISPVKMPVWFAIKETGKDILSRFTSPTKEKTPFVEIGKSFETTSPAKFEETAFSYYPSGTIATDQPPLKEVTYGDVQAQRDIKFQVEVGSKVGSARSDIDKYYTGLQSDIFKGKISYTDAIEKGEKFVAEKQIEVGEVYKEAGEKYPMVEGLGTRQNIFQGVTKFVSYAPEIAPFALAVSAKEDPLRISNLEDVKSGKLSLGGAITSPPSITTKTYMGASLLGGIGGAIFKYKALERAIVSEDLAIATSELSKQPFKFGSVLIDEGRTGSVILKGTRATRGIKQEVVLTGDIFKRGGREFLMPKGKADVTTVGKLDWNILGGAKESYLIHAGRFDVGGKGVSLISGKGLSIGIGKGVIEPQFQSSAIFQLPKTFKQAEKYGTRIAKDWRKNLVFGGDTTIGIDYPIVSAKVGKDTYLGLIPREGEKGLREIGLTQVIRSPRESVSFGSRIIGGRKTPFLRTFTDQVPQLPVPQETLTSAINLQAARTLPSIIRPSKFETPLKGIQRMVGGGGLLTSQLPQVRGRGVFGGGFIS